MAEIPVKPEILTNERQQVHINDTKMAQFRNGLASIPPVTKNLLIINIGIWLVEFLFQGFANGALMRHCGLHYVGASDFNPVQLITYMFLHDPGNPLHIFFNMFTLWMFGRLLERVWGSRRFFVFYMVCGIGAALVQECVWALTWRHDYIEAIAQLNGLTFEHMKQIVDQAAAAGNANFIEGMEQMKGAMVTVGASGAIFGLLLGFAMTFPNVPLYLFFIPVPIKAKYMVIGYAVLEFFFGISGGDTVAHFAHLGGLLFGLIMILWWRHKGTLHSGGYR